METYPKTNTLFKRFNKIINPDKIVSKEIEQLMNIDWVLTEKIDGTNIRITIQVNDCGEYIIKVKGREEISEIPDGLSYKLAQIVFGNEHLFQKVFKGEPGLEVCIYGEGYGNKIQGNRKYFESDDEYDFIVFDIKIGEYWLERGNVEDICRKLNLKIVPILGYGTLHDMIRLVKSGFKSTIGNCRAEGIVAYPMYQLFDRKGKRITAKLKYSDFIKLERSKK